MIMEREGGKGGEAGEARGGKGYGLVKDVWLSLKWGKGLSKMTSTEGEGGRLLKLADFGDKE